MEVLQLAPSPAGNGPPMPPRNKTMYACPDNDDNDKKRMNKPIRKRKKSVKRRIIEQIQLTYIVEKELLKKANHDSEKREYYLSEIETLQVNRRIWRNNLYSGKY